MGKITLSNEPGGTTTGDSYIVATNLKTVSDADRESGQVHQRGVQPDADHHRRPGRRRTTCSRRPTR